MLDNLDVLCYYGLGQSKYLRKTGVTMSKTIMTKQKFANQWLRHFAKDIDKKKLQESYVDQYIWHIFSFRLLEKGSFLEGEAARHAYDSIDKSNCIFCDMFGQNGVTDKALDEYATAASIDSNVTELSLWRRTTLGHTSKPTNVISVVLIL